MYTDTLQRRRQKAPRRKTGCLTCKKRHLRCDETRPVCSRCKRGGYKCDGYPYSDLYVIQSAFGDAALSLHARENQGRDDMETDEARQANAITLTLCSLNTSFGTNDEGWYLSRFRERTALQISIFSSPYFWNVLVPQASWSHPAVKHALVATAMASECKEDESVKPRLEDRSVLHYTKAISSLVRSDESSSQEIVLLTCMLLLMHDNFTQRANAVIAHLRGAVRILNEIGRNRSAGLSSSDRDDVVSTCIRPAYQEGLMLANILNPKPGQRGPVSPGKSKTVPLLDMANFDHFKDLEDAESKLNSCISSKTEDRRKLLDMWLSAFQKYQGAGSATEMRLLYAHHRCAMMALEVDDRDDQDEGSDSPMDVSQFASLLGIVKSLVPHFHGHTEKTTVKLGLIPLVCFIYRHCEEKNIRLQSLRLLKQMDRMEGIWNSAVAAEAIEVVIKLEEYECWQYYSTHVFDECSWTVAKKGMYCHLPLYHINVLDPQANL